MMFNLKALSHPSSFLQSPSRNLARHSFVTAGALLLAFTKACSRTWTAVLWVAEASTTGARSSVSIMLFAVSIRTSVPWVGGTS